MKEALVIIYVFVGFGTAMGANICKPSYFKEAGIVKSMVLAAVWPMAAGVSIVVPACGVSK